MVVQEAKCKGYDKLYSCWQRRENIIFIHLTKKREMRTRDLNGVYCIKDKDPKVFVKEKQI